jgi:hypothetical protein
LKLSGLWKISVGEHQRLRLFIPTSLRGCTVGDHIQAQTKQTREREGQHGT